MIKPTKIRLYRSHWRCYRYGQTWFDASRVASLEQPAKGTNGVLERVPECLWPRPRRSTRQSRCRRSSWGRYQVSARRTSVLRVGCLMWLTYSIDFIVPAKIGEESILAKDINNYKSHAYILVFFGVFWQKLVPIINNDYICRLNCYGN